MVTFSSQTFLKDLDKKLWSAADYADIPGFCKSTIIEEIATHDFVLTPGRYVEVEEQEEQIRATLKGLDYAP